MELSAQKDAGLVRLGSPVPFKPERACHGQLLSGLVPVVADGESEKGVVTGIVIAEAGAGEVAESGFKLERAALAGENVRAKNSLGGEIHV